jgi:hypothetical protein
MPRLFGAYIMVDWSAASKPATGEDSIWVGHMRRDVRFRPVYAAHNPSTRKAAEDLIRTLIDDHAKRGERVLLGLDFPLGYPAGASIALKLKDQPPWRALHAFLAKEVKDKPDNSNNRFQVAAMMNRTISGGPFPFWGCPPRDTLTTLQPKKGRPHGDDDVPEFRHAERIAKGAQPVWKLYTSGNVGSQALMGIPVVKRLKDAFGASLALWPFETGWKTLTEADLDGVAIVAAEIYPSLFAATAAAGEVKDATQVRATAEHFLALDEKNQLGAVFGPKADQAGHAEAVVQEEGWILGV